MTALEVQVNQIWGNEEETQVFAHVHDEKGSCLTFRISQNNALPLSRETRVVACFHDLPVASFDETFEERAATHAIIDLYDGEEGTRNIIYRTPNLNGPCPAADQFMHEREVFYRTIKTVYLMPPHPNIQPPPRAVAVAGHWEDQGQALLCGTLYPNPKFCELQQMNVKKDL
ncbi:hypothetical protein TGAM01_v204273 [Trichoderma gamsii]|uniref:Uncharacterized protein n=1 Tax=Trichoderma gamsii TaxID=398673 RepID=A0A2P4ZR66_9HYPO|nr:hypothetical protein TGAM01_v204273 [Trichoderma gamsii]PON26772.1 hypothetical protein TGAM01_v204273 [Trichoderma gamsii]